MQNGGSGAAASARRIQLALADERLRFRDDSHAMLIHAAAQQEAGLHRRVTVQTEERSVSRIFKNWSGPNGAPEGSAGELKQEEFWLPRG